MSKFGGEPRYNLDIISYIQIVSVCSPKWQISMLNIKFTKEERACRNLEANLDTTWI